MSGPDGSPGSQSAPAPLVGRERELAMLRAALAAAVGGHGSLVLIGGEAGIGKTALAEALLVEAAAAGALVLVGRCYDLSETPPYGPWIEALAAGPREVALPVLPSAILALARDGEALLPGQEAIVACVRDYLVALTTARPVVLLLDDLHWADPASLDLLRVLARGLGDLPLLLLATYRDDELTQRHPLYLLLPLLEREGHAMRVDLRRLGKDALYDLVRRYALSDEENARLVAWLAGRAEGNAFFTVQLLRALEGEGVLAETDTGWALGDLQRVGLPPLLRQVLTTRLARLGEESQRLLALAAVVGQEVPLALWAEVAAVGEDDLLDTIDAAAEARLVLATPDGAAVHFAHALIREALYEGLVATRRRRVHRQAGEILAAATAPDPDAVANHFRRAGDARATTWLVRAGERAQRAFAYQTAAARYDAALHLMAADETQAGERGWLLARLAWLRDRVITPADLALLDEAAHLAAAVDDPALATATRFARGWLLYRLGQIRAGIASLEAAATAAAALPPVEQERLNRLDSSDRATSAVARYRGVLVRVRAMWGPFADAATLGEQLVAEVTLPSTGQGFDGITAQALGGIYDGLAIAHAMLGHPVEAARAFTEARAAYRAPGQFVNHFALGALADFELHLLTLPYFPEHIATRRHLAAEIEGELSQAAGMGPIIPRFLLVPLMFLEGAWPEARVLAAAHVASAVQGGQRRAAHAWLGIMAHAQGELDLAWAQVRVLLPDGPATAPEDVSGNGRFLLGLPAALALDAGDLPLAHKWLACYDRWLSWSGAMLGRAECQLLWSAYQRSVGNTSMARERAEVALAHASDPRQPVAQLAAYRALGVLDLEAGHYHSASVRLEAALALADTCAAPYERALTLLDCAALRLTSGDQEEARSALADARALLAPMDAHPALARADALATRLSNPGLPFGLSAREAEVLRLVAEGLSDAAVAERLFVSRFTVKAHMRSVYNKLGTSSRTAAARLALQHGLTR